MIKTCKYNPNGKSLENEADKLKADRRKRPTQNKRKRRLKKKKPRKYKAGGLGYRHRDKILLQLGFGNYHAYLRSKLWNRIRRRVMKRDNYQCGVCCLFAAVSVHHLRYTYGNLSGENIDNMVATCLTCHWKCEFDNDGKKRAQWAARQTTVTRMNNDTFTE